MGQIFRRAEKYLDQLDTDSIGAFVEIGSSRNGDDGSTRVIANWAARFDQNLFTVDMDPVQCDLVRSFNLPNVEVFNTTGENYLSTMFHGHISVLYLDNFDWDWHPMNTEAFVLEQQERYDQLGKTMTNLNSQMAHLNQAILAVPCMTETSLIVCDDTWFNEHWGHYSGKSGAAVPYLVGQGFRVLETEEYPTYGTILGRNING
jgi:hypothetical protein